MVPNRLGSLRVRHCAFEVLGVFEQLVEVEPHGRFEGSGRGNSDFRRHRLSGLESVQVVVLEPVWCRQVRGKLRLLPGAHASSS